MTLLHWRSVIELPLRVRQWRSGFATFSLMKSMVVAGVASVSVQRLGQGGTGSEKFNKPLILVHLVPVRRPSR